MFTRVISSKSLSQAVIMRAEFMHASPCMASDNLWTEFPSCRADFRYICAESMSWRAILSGFDFVPGSAAFAKPAIHPIAATIPMDVHTYGGIFIALVLCSWLYDAV